MNFPARSLWTAALLSGAALLLSACNNDDNNSAGSSSSSSSSSSGGSSSSGSSSGAAPVTLSLSFTAPGASFDIANYTRVGQYALPVGTDPANRLAAEASAVAYDKDTDSLYVVGDGGTAVVRVSKQDGSLLDSMPLAADATKPQGTYFYDTEGLAYAGGGKFVLIEERFRQADLFTYVAGTTLQGSAAQTVKLGTTIGNIGLEGGSFDPKTGGYIFVKEKEPEGVFQTSIDFAAGTASNGSPITDESQNLFDPSLLGVADLADVFAVSNIAAADAPEYSDLLLLSQESGMVVQADRSGKVKGRLVTDLNAQIEGITMDGDHTLYLANELGGGDGHPQLWVYKPAADPKKGVGVGSNLYLGFSQAVTAGSGYIVLDDGAGNPIAIPVGDDDQISIANGVVTINPEHDLLPGHSYTVTIPDGAFKDAGGKAITGVGSLADLSFTTVGDILPPLLQSSVPAAGATAVTASQIALTFSEAVKAGAGNITLSGADGDVRNIAVTDAQVVFNGSTVTITPAAALHPATVYSVQIANAVITDTAGNAYAGLTGSALSFTTAAASGPTTLGIGDLLFVGANADSPDAIAFILLKPVNAGTQIGLSDKDYKTTTGWPTNEAAYMWTADVAYPAGTIVTIQPDNTPVIVDKGTITGAGGGISASGETYYAFQGTITDASTGKITANQFLASLNVGGAAAGDIPPDLTSNGVALSFPQDNVRYNGSLDATNIATLTASIKNPANWSTSDSTPFAITGNSLFPPAAAGPSTLAAGDLLFVGANSDSPDAVAFILLKAVNAGTLIGFTDKDYAGTATWPTNEAAFMWTADVAYPAGTIVTIQPGTPSVDKGSVAGTGGGISNDGETYYAFQGTITDANAGQITVDHFLATLNVGGAAAGVIPGDVTTAGTALTFTEDNVKYTGSFDAANLATNIKNTTNWTTSDATAFPLTGGSLFP